MTTDEIVDGRARFRDAMSSFPSGVTIVTTTDDAGEFWGFTATSFCSVSMDPALVLVCLADTAQCHPAFAAANRWTIHILHSDHSELAVRFATRGEDKFANAGFEVNCDGVPVLSDASIRLDCVAHEKVVAGDHTILVGEVVDTYLGAGNPTIYFKRKFHTLP
ncbi:flavin reductase family protein [Rhodococcus sp. OK302]|uniref:flavin reductase family protein n=1 Tax=Rhodococcus sp. OK302 TaxID=1882769 RepID=UPI000B93A92A|nr:flavin reductase family protein [Rhodococcus sp. OK302]OYD70403.1 flavin reductase ActVB [Rhodococcus sp. OK302]